MKKLTILLLAILSMASAWAQGGSGAGYDPINPPDPEAGYRLTVQASPQKGGNVTPERPRYYQAGSEIYCEAYARLGYEFRAWMQGDQVIATSPSLYYQMPEEDVVLTAWFDKVDFNPANPGDPFLDGYTHRVSVYSSPSSGGWFNNDNFLMLEGEENMIYAYPNSNFKFSCWKQDGKIISTDPYLPITMGTKNLEYTAQFVYDPASPANPGSNSWNEATGELVIDDFQPGYLWDAIYNLVGYEGMENVAELTVIGAMDNYDMGVVRNFPGLTVADFSRTSGAEYVPAWIFENCEALTKVLLPSSISNIEYCAFYGCQNLSELVVYAAMPPGIDSSSFYGVPADMVVKVYSGSLDIYANTAIWQDYKIMTIDEDSTAFTVLLPADAADGRYRNASLQLSNLSTGQTQKLLVTGNRVKYIFGNLIPEMKYSLYAIAPNGCVIGKYLEIEMPKEGLEYQFPSLLALQEVKLSLITPEGDDVADAANVAWYDETHKFLGSGCSLAGQVEGYEVSYEITLPRELGVLYAFPANGTHTVAASDNVVKIDLKAFAKTTLEGAVYDAKSTEPVAGSYVTVSQTLNGLYDVATTVAVDNDGAYKIEIYDAPVMLTAGNPDYFEKSFEFASPAEANTNGKLMIESLAGTEISLSLLSRDNVVKGDPEDNFADYEDYANINYEIHNTTQGNKIENFKLRYPRLLILDDVKDGDRLVVIATPTAGSYNSTSGETVVKDGNADLKLIFTSNGDLQASYASSKADEVVGMLYDKKGMLLKKEAYTDGELTFSHLGAGDYTLVTMMASKLFSSVGSMAELEASALQKGKDYLTSDVEIENGYIAKVKLDEVPVFDESLFYYTGPETSISVNKKSVTVGQIVTVRSKVDFLEEYAGRIEKVNITFTIPDGCEYVENSLLVSGNGSNFTTIEGNRITVSTSLKDATPRFCIIPRKSGDFRPSAMIEFELDGETICQPIGSALFSASDFLISVPARTSVPTITARGVATALSDVKVYDNGVFIGSTRSLTNGSWHLKFDLFNPGDYSEHLIYAEITTPEGQKYNTTTGKTIYDKEWAELTDIHMIYGGTTVDFNHIDATTTPASYSYVPGNNAFTFKAIFREGHSDRVKDLDFVILLSDGSRRRIDGKYLAGPDAWVCALGFDDINALPVNVKVLYTEKRDNDDKQARDLVDVIEEAFRCPDVVPVIDPSGFVYEAVPSNRLEGVMATIYYKELKEDIYGDIYEDVIKWDAEAYAQENPLFTDASGMYQWDVPQGEWQVKFEKEGYEATQTEWLPVPPPQLDVNVGMVQTVRPEVKSARAYEQAVEIEFDKYMRPELLNASTISVMINDKAVEGTLSMVNAENDGDNEYASAIRFEAAEPFTGTTIKLMVSNKVESYAGIKMEEAFVQEFPIESEIKEISVAETVDAYIGIEKAIAVSVAPAEAAAGKTLLVQLGSPIATVSEAVEIDENGNAIVTVDGELPGTTTLTFTIEDSRAEAAVSTMTFTVAPEPAEAPVASIASGATVAVGSTVALTTATEGAQIWYTLDGTSPVDNDARVLYTEPIVITGNTTIMAVAGGENWLESEVAEFKYFILAAEAPKASVEDGATVAVGSTVALTTATEGAQIWYTLDGTSPVDNEARVLYTEPIVITGNTTIMAVAGGDKWAESEVAEFNYFILVAEAPKASVEDGSTVAVGSKVALTSATEGAQIWYTLDGTSPVDNDARVLYTEPIVISGNTTIMAVAGGDKWAESEVAEFNYSVLTAEAPEASIASGSAVKEGTELTLTTETENGQIWYTTDGTDPLTSNTAIAYSSPIVISADVTIKAAVKAEGQLDSEVVEFKYTVETVSGINGVTSGELCVIPTTSHNGFIVKGVADSAIVAVFDTNGNAAMPAMTIFSDQTIEMSDSAPGVYFVKVVAQGKSATLKFMKR